MRVTRTRTRRRRRAPDASSGRFEFPKPLSHRQFRCMGGIARCENISILYVPTLLRTQCRGRRRDHRAYDDVRATNLQGGSMAARKKAAKRGAKKTAKRGKKAAKRGKKK